MLLKLQSTMHTVSACVNAVQVNVHPHLARIHIINTLPPNSHANYMYSFFKELFHILITIPVYAKHTIFSLFQATLLVLIFTDFLIVNDLNCHNWYLPIKWQKAFILFILIDIYIFPNSFPIIGFLIFSTLLQIVQPVFGITELLW